MALRFNPPPNWPAPPEGFVPPAGWQPDPAWGPAPEGWQLWVDDASASSAPAVSSAAAASSATDPAWAPTQAVPTGSSPVADPTGQQVSAPSADFPASSAPMASPYSASMDYAQSPTPYQPGAGQPGFGPQPQAAAWQPLDVAGSQASQSKPVTKQWWFWTIIAVVVIALVGALVYALVGGDDDSKPAAQSTQKPAQQATQQTTQQATAGGVGGGGSSAQPSATASGGSGDCQQGSSQKCPGDLRSQTLTLKASEYASDPNATVDLSFGDVVWDATEEVRAAWKYGFVEPSSGYVYMRLPVTVTYHGEGQLNLFSLNFKYVHDGNTFRTEYVFVSNELNSQSAPYDGGSVTGYVTFLIPAEYANSGAFAISFNYTDEYWMAEL